MQLVAYGAQDIYLTGNPQITFFKVVYRRHTNFSMEEIAQTPNGDATLGTSDKTATFTISRNGDLVHKMYFQVDTGGLKLAGGDYKEMGHFGPRLIKEVECEIGGQKIDRHFSHWLSTWGDLTEPNDRGFKGIGITAGHGANGSENASTIGYGVAADNSSAGCFGHTKFNRTVGNALPGKDEGIKASSDKTIHIPLQFWFNRNPGLALPLIALQYHEVKINAVFQNTKVFTEHENGFDASYTPTVELYAQYIYLDTDERRRFAQVSHEYLIEQVQQQIEEASPIITLNFNHPVKELIWHGERTSAAAGVHGMAQPFWPNSKWQLQLNGHDRFSERPLEYFTRQQIYDYHTGYGFTHNDVEGIAVYSFALKPEEHQPSGTCNFSRIDTAQLKTDSTGVPMEIFAVNYNVLRIMSGMGGLAYSN